MTAIRFLAEWALRSSALILAAGILLRVLRVKAPSIVLAAWTAVLAGSLAIPAIPMILPRVPVTVSRTVAALPVAHLEHQATTASESSLPSAPKPLIAPPRGTSHSSFDAAGAVTILYALVATGLLARLFLGWILSRHMMNSAALTGERADGIEVRESSRVSSPVAFGVVSPVIVLPNDWRDWDGAKLAAVLAHERSHIRRRDPALQFLSSIHRALLWHSPLSWFLHRRIVRVAEEASDDAALAAARDRASYAEVLLEFMQRGLRRTGWQGVPMARYCEPEERIHRILDGSTIARGVTRWSAAAIVILGVPLTYLAAAAHPRRVLQAPAVSPQVAGPVVAESAASPPASPPPIHEQAQAQTSPPAPAPTRPLSFDAASVKPYIPPPPGRGGRNGGGGPARGGGPGTDDPSRIHYGGILLIDLILRAYDVKGFQVSAPNWVFSERYTIDATEPPDTTMEQFRLMLRNLLAERFKMQSHREGREHAMYTLTVAKGGPKLKESQAAAPGSGAADTPRPTSQRFEFDSQGFPTLGLIDIPPGRPWRFVTAGGRHRIGGQQVTITDLTQQLTTELGSPVTDQTGLSGKYDYMLTFSSEGLSHAIEMLRPPLPSEPATPASDSPPLPPLPNLFSTIQSELGLKLEQKKGSLETIVIDHIEKAPTDN